MRVQVARYRFTVDEYHRMGAAGIFREDDRVELLDGEIVRMTPIGSRHAGCVKALNQMFARLLGSRALVAVQDPIRLGAHSEPHPDLVLLRPRPDFYRESHPEPGDVWLVVEVSDTTGALDREVKLPLYAAAGIPEVWLVDLPAEAVEAHRRPASGRYGEVARRGRGERVGCAAFPDLDIPVDAILG